jgi:hypothetical protein
MTWSDYRFAPSRGRKKLAVVPLPNVEARTELVSIYSKDLNMSGDVSKDELVRMTDSYSGSDIRDILQSAQIKVVRELFQSQKITERSRPRAISMEDIREILRRRRPSVSSEMLRFYDKLEGIDWRWASLERLKDGRYMALFHDDGRFLHNAGKTETFKVYKTLSSDGGLHWSAPEIIATHPEAHLCEPGLIRSPDGRQIAGIGALPQAQAVERQVVHGEPVRTGIDCRQGIGEAGHDQDHDRHQPHHKRHPLRDSPRPRKLIRRSCSL